MSDLKSPAPALSQGLAILELAAAPEGATFSELVDGCGASKATVIRLLKVLTEAGYLLKSPGNGRYVPGGAARRLAGSQAFLSLLVDASRPTLAQVAETTENTCLLLWRDGNWMQSIDKVTAEQSIAMQPIGSRCSDLTLTPWGWCLIHALATEQGVAPADYLRRCPGERTVDPACFAAFEKTGVMLDACDRKWRIRRLAAPIVEGSGRPCGFLALGGNELTIPDRKVKSFGRTLVQAAQDLSAHWQNILKT